MNIRPAATLALTRDAEDGLEVLLLQRTWDAVFMPGFYVFPGGAVDEADQACAPHHDGEDDHSISALLDIDQGGADYMVAAIRECFEEAGLLMALDDKGHDIRPEHPVFGRREALIRGEINLAELCVEYRLALPLDRLAYLSHWVTPPGPPRRYDTRFFVALAPEHQTAREDGVETIDHVWLSPRQALDDHRLGTRLFGSPTLRTLRVLSEFDSTDALMAHARSNPPEGRGQTPWLAQKGNRQVSVEAGSPPYDEVRYLDPDRRGQARAEILPGEAVVLGAGIQRLTAPNPSVMTGPGTNSYLLGNRDSGFTVIDPGPDERRHLDRIIELTGGDIRLLLTTHTHPDHSSGCGYLKETTGAPVRGMPAPSDTIQDASFRADLSLDDGDRIETGAGTLRAIHTPGHASNHVCFLLEDEGMLFSGDHIMQGSTVVINPPDGDMKDYLQSLHELLQLPLQRIAPGHGFLLGQPHAIIDYLTTHRLTRERKVIEVLQEHGPGTVRELTVHAYDDVPEAVHGLASRSLLAHLIKLEKDNRATCEQDRWRSL